MKTVSLSEIYRVIAGHSNYHGDSILAALTCIAEGKEVSPIKPIETVEPKCGEWLNGMTCSNCGQVDYTRPNFCSTCGADMRK